MSPRRRRRRAGAPARPAPRDRGARRLRSTPRDGNRRRAAPCRLRPARRVQRRALTRRTASRAVPRCRRRGRRSRQAVLVVAQDLVGGAVVEYRKSIDAPHDGARQSQLVGGAATALQALQAFREGAPDGGGQRLAGLASKFTRESLSLLVLDG